MARWLALLASLLPPLLPPVSCDLVPGKSITYSSRPGRLFAGSPPGDTEDVAAYEGPTGEQVNLSLDPTSSISLASTFYSGLWKPLQSQQCLWCLLCEGWDLPQGFSGGQGQDSLRQDLAPAGSDLLCQG